MAELYSQFKDFKSFEVVFTDEQNQLQKLFCTIKNIENNRIIIDSNNNVSNNVMAKVGDELKLNVYTENGIYSAVSKVLTVSKGISNTEYVIAYPYNSKYSQRREYFRAEIPVEFRVTVFTNDAPEEPIHIEGKAKNICGKGMCYVSNRPFPEYDSIQVEMFFKERTITTLASLVYSKTTVVNNHPAFIHAFTFTNISKNNIDFIVKKCFLYQLELRKKQK